MCCIIKLEVAKNCCYQQRKYSSKQKNEKFQEFFNFAYKKHTRSGRVSSGTLVNNNRKM